MKCWCEALRSERVDPCHRATKSVMDRLGFTRAREFGVNECVPTVLLMGIQSTCGIAGFSGMF
jgi:hypothetical protein